MELAVKDIHFSITIELCHHLPVIQLVSFLECTHISSEQSPVQYCAALRDERLLVGNLLLTLLSKTDHSGSMVFKSDDCAGQGRC